MQAAADRMKLTLRDDDVCKKLTHNCSVHCCWHDDTDTGMMVCVKRWRKTVLYSAERNPPRSEHWKSFSFQILEGLIILYQQLNNIIIIMASGKSTGLTKYLAGGKKNAVNCTNLLSEPVNVRIVCCNNLQLVLFHWLLLTWQSPEWSNQQRHLLLALS